MDTNGNDIVIRYTGGVARIRQGWEHLDEDDICWVAVGREMFWGDPLSVADPLRRFSLNTDHVPFFRDSGFGNR